MKHPVLFVAFFALAGISCHGVSKSSGPARGYPVGYLKWHRIGGTIKRGAEFRRIYANDLAFQRVGKEFPVGTVLVKEELSINTAQGGDMPGAAFRLSVMRKVGKAAGNKGGWSFEAYDPNTKKRISKAVLDTTGCYLCHVQKSANDMVFSHIP